MKSELTRIEQALFGGKNVAHGIVEFALRHDDLYLVVAPLNNLTEEVTATFRRARILAMDAYGEGPDDWSIPWNVIGFDDQQEPDGYCKFVLHTDCIECAFKSTWPTIAKRER